MAEVRFDLGALRPAQRMPDGRVRVDAHITRVGVFEYRDAKGKVTRELRLPEDVFDPESMRSFQQVPVTNEHPSVGLLRADNATRYMVGATGETVARDDDHVRTTMMVADANTIAEMEQGKKQVSCGYTCEMDRTPGVHPVYGKYDARQKNIRGNHVAIVGAARAGDTAQVRLDSTSEAAVRLDDTQPGADRVDHNGKRGPMDPEQLQKNLAAVGLELTNTKAKLADAEDKLAKATFRADSEQGKREQVEKDLVEARAAAAAASTAVVTAQTQDLQTKLDAATAEVARFDERINARVKERVKLEREAGTILGPEVRLDDMTDREVIATVVKRLDREADVSSKVSDGVLTGRYQALVEGAARSARANAHIAQVMVEQRQDGAAGREVRQDHKQRIRDQWKAPLPNDIRTPRKEA